MDVSGSNILMIRNILFILILLYASYCDIKTRIIPDKVHVIITLVALVNIDLLSSLLGLLLVPLPMLLIAMMSGGIGGGDIKLVGACSFYLGFRCGLIGLIIGLTVAVVVNIGYNKFKCINHNSKFALIPYLSIGYLIMVML